VVEGDFSTPISMNSENDTIAIQNWISPTLTTS